MNKNRRIEVANKSSSPLPLFCCSSNHYIFNVSYSIHFLYRYLLLDVPNQEGTPRNKQGKKKWEFTWTALEKMRIYMDCLRKNLKIRTHLCTTTKPQFWVCEVFTKKKDLFRPPSSLFYLPCYRPCYRPYFIYFK